jgi:hypothetical protein
LPKNHHHNKYLKPLAARSGKAREMRFPAHFSRNRRFYHPGMIQKPIEIRL